MQVIKNYFLEVWQKILYERRKYFFVGVSTLLALTLLILGIRSQYLSQRSPKSSANSYVYPAARSLDPTYIPEALKYPQSEIYKNTSPSPTPPNSDTKKAPTPNPLPTLKVTPTQFSANKPALNITDRVSYYNISGTSEDELRDEMNEKGVTVSGNPGEIFDAKTEWNIYWNYPRQTTSQGCTTGGVSVIATIDITLPYWVNKNEASTELQNKWNTYLENLSSHENQHKQHTVEAANEVYSKLNSMSFYPNCQVLDTNVNDAGNSILDALRARYVSFDAETDHGRNQGAKFH